LSRSSERAFNPRPFDAAAIAARVRALVGGHDHSEIAARRLGVSELALRVTTDEDEPMPTLTVLAAVVRELGVDPTWLLTGSYNAVTHRRVLEGHDGEPDRPVAARLTRGRPPRHAESDRPQSHSAHVRLEA
jgi:hypothetical protein